MFIFMVSKFIVYFYTLIAFLIVEIKNNKQYIFDFDFLKSNLEYVLDKHQL